MTTPTTENEHIRGAVELVRAKARKRLALLKTKETEGSVGVREEIVEIERIERLASEAWTELAVGHQQDAS
jgi:hypothetical protein